MAMAREIAEWVGAQTASNGGVELTAVSSIEAATEAMVVFATDARTLALALQSSAGLILANATLMDGTRIDGSGSADRVIGVANARYAFAQVAHKLQSPSGRTEVHPTVVIAASVHVGAGTKISAGCVIGEGVVIGKACMIGPNVTVYADTTIADRVNVQAGAVLGAKGFGYVKNMETGEYLLFPQQGTLVVEDDVDIGANTTIDRGALGETRIGRGSKLDNLVHIGHNCLIGKNVIIAAQTGISGSSVVEDGAILGGQVGIGEHAVVGVGVILGGGAGVLSGKKMRGPGEIFWGRPARPLKEYLRDLARLKKR